MNDLFTARLHQHATTLKQQGLYRKRQIMQADDCLHFSSNDYLSLTHDPRVKQAYQTGFKRYPVGSGGATVVCGYHSIHRELEQAFIEALAVDDCLLFSSGYAANLSVVSLLAQLDASLLIDKAVHASVYDGIQLAGAKFTRYLHQDLDDLADKVQHASLNTVIMTEGIFSMSGQCAPLAEITLHQLNLIVDEAHAFGVLGDQGLGAVVHANLTQTNVPLRVIPFGKGLAASGAIVAGRGDWIEALVQTRPSVYSTAMSPAYAYGLLETLAILRKADDRRAKLTDLVAYFRELIQQSPLKWRDSVTPIQQLQLGCPHLAAEYAQKLLTKSIKCLPIRQPTVTKQETGLRIILNYQHEREDIDMLFNCLHTS